ncbi:MAG: hypothetical protein ABR82_06440 [Verrucomicrobia subdivision 6 bacterium BACL9 MAG-120507-bin52]|uniref:Uncharacterized protein n=2 Tax=Verrucomicrobia subdivision 6 TaxID=134627 RepID=A0A0R2RNJ8_9BACT|nr:MAG: hypothetical protein ABR82_06440 [Verrucomicrobia subdivision 6 bacterium BACL9 MAG-120507-bin52]
MRRRSPEGIAEGAKGGPERGLGCRGGGRIDMDAAVSLIKADPTMGESEEGVIPAHTDVLPGLKFGAALADNDRAGGDGFATEAFHSQPLTAAIATISCRSLSFFMGHDGFLGYWPAWIF